MQYTRENELDPETRPAEEIAWMTQATRNPAAFGPLYERYFGRIFNYCYRRTGQLEEAEDLAARVFTSALHNLRNFRGGSVAAWLFQIAHNAVLNHLRDKKPVVPLDRAWQLPLEAETALDRLVDLERRQQVRQLIEALPDEQKELLALSFIGELNSREIGQVVGKSDTAVRMALHRIIKQLRDGYRQAEAIEEWTK